jgi:hypothetical protein
MGALEPAMRPILPFLFLLALVPACPANSGTTDASTGDATDATTTDDQPTGGESTGEPADLNDRELGAGASELCRGAMTHVADLAAAVAAGDAAAATAAYAGTDLQTLVVAIDGAEGTADAAITAALAIGDATELAGAEARVHVALIAHLRASMTAVEEGTDDHYASWDEAHCVWDGGLRPLGVAADAVTWTTIDESIVADIDLGFAEGHNGIQGEPPNASGDDWRLPPNKQRVEKSVYRAVQRVIVELATTARDDADPAAARRALELFISIESRLEGRNTPGIAQVQAILGGDPAMIDPQAVLTELDIAFAKRTRTYASAAIDANELGAPAGYKGAVEGGTYARLVVPGMADKVSGFDQTMYLGAWDRYADLVREGTALEELNAISMYLAETTCAYQTALGVAACSGDVDETE